MTGLPPLASMILADEYTLTRDQEDHLLEVSAERRQSRFWIAPVGTPAPGPTRDGERLTEPWNEPWQQLNNPGSDAMVGVLVMDESGPARGLLILVSPTRAARRAWLAARRETYPAGARSIGVETGLRVPHPHADYRAVFRCVEPLPEISRRTVRWRYRRPMPGKPAYDIITGGWLPEAERRRRAAEDLLRAITS